LKHITRVIIPDSHGAHIDPKAKKAFLKDLARLKPEQIVMMGDHLDCGGTFNTHQRNYTHEICETYDDDVAAANSFLDAIRYRAPNASIHYLEGNHEAHVERWASRLFHNKKDADKLLERFGPIPVLRLKEREIKYYKRSEHYMGLSIPGAIKLGKCYYVHGISHSKHAAATHLARFGANVVHGHTHRSQSTVERTVTSDGFGAWCPGTLAKLQPLYAHTAPTSWSHGYAIQFCNLATGTFIHFNVPIFRDRTLLLETIDTLARKKAS
jgi:predicted phosphodiesterase